MKTSTRTRITIVALIATVAGTGIAVAGPSSKPAKRGVDDMHITITAGRGRLGFAALQISSGLRQFMGAPADRGVLVDNVRPDSPAERAGLRVGDIIVDVDGDRTSSAQDVLSAIADRKKGDVVSIEVVRGGGRETLQATLDDDPGVASKGFRFGTQDWPQFDMKPLFGDRDRERLLQETRKRLDELERRLEKLDGKRT